MSLNQKCPKCEYELLPENYLFGYGAVRRVKFGDVCGDNVAPSYCRNCGYTELYNGKNLKR